MGPDPIVVPLSGWSGSLAEQGAGSVVGAGLAGGSIEPADVYPYGWSCRLNACPGLGNANSVEVLLNLIQGTDPSRAWELFNDTPD
ncbi:hypothetical protein RHCRD62_70225 [Rhodococcus sp. RD6.2]|nr:hypothetical protein RHCRD62_70225 [Rhodococcus sp. RD6.2]